MSPIRRPSERWPGCFPRVSGDEPTVSWEGVSREVFSVSVVALDEERNVVDGKRSCGCSTQDLPGATLDGRVGDRVESSDALIGSLASEDTTREARPVEGPVLTDQINSESCGHLHERRPTGFENLTGNYVGIGDQCTQRLEGSGH